MKTCVYTRTTIGCIDQAVGKGHLGNQGLQKYSNRPI